MKFSSRIGMTLLANLVATLSTGCGGGGGGGDLPSASLPTVSVPVPVVPAIPVVPATGPAGDAEGLWRDGGSGGASYVLIESTGKLWGQPQVLTSLTSLGIAYTGAVATKSGNVTGSYSDIFLRTCSIYTCSVQGLASSTQLTLAGAKYFGGSTVPLPDWSFSSTAKEASYSIPASIAPIVGSWRMRAYVTSNFDSAGTLTVGILGEVTASNIGGCSFSGTLTPVANKGYYHLTLSAAGGICASGVTPREVTGIAYQTTVGGPAPVLHVQWHNPSMTQDFWGSGTK